MHQLPHEIWKNHLTIYLSDADFLHLITTCRTFYYEYSQCKRIRTRYPVSQIYHIVDHYDFSEVIYDLKNFYPEYLPYNLDVIQFWGLSKTTGQMSLKSYPRVIIYKSMDSMVIQTCQDIRMLISPRLESLQVDVWSEKWMGTLTCLTRLADLSIKKYYVDIPNIPDTQGQKDLNYYFGSLKHLTRLSILTLIGKHKNVTISNFPPQLKSFRFGKYPQSHNIILKNLPRSITSLTLLTVPILDTTLGIHLTQLKVLNITDPGSLEDVKATHHSIHQIVRKIPELPFLEEFKITSDIYSPKRIFVSSKTLRKLSITCILKNPWIIIKAPLLRRLTIAVDVTLEDRPNRPKFKLETPLLASLNIQMNLAENALRDLENELIPKLTNLDTLKLVSDDLTLDVQKLGTQMQSIKLYGFNPMLFAQMTNMPFIKMTRLKDLRLKYSCVGDEHYHISKLPSSLTRLELNGITNKELDFSGAHLQLKRLDISNAPNLTELMLPNSLTHLGIYTCTNLRKMNVSRSILKIIFLNSRKGILEQIKYYVQNSPKNIVLIHDSSN
jgi:hypothetical protein